MSKTLVTIAEESKGCCTPTCCGTKADESTTKTTQSMTRVVQEKYGAVAASTLSSNHAGVHAVAKAFGYSAEELAGIPAAANMGLSCGNPTATAHLEPGEVVVDLGSGGGLDVFLASQQVGPMGRAIGIDMTPKMIERARAAAAEGVNGVPYTNVEFLLGSIDQIPLPDGSVDVILSNCVINLATDKRRVFAEMFRVLKPGGRVAVSDIALRKPLPDELATDIAAYVGCFAGALEVGEFDRGLAACGFRDVLVVDAKSDLNAYGKVEGQSGCCSPAAESSPDVGLHVALGDLSRRYDLNEYAASVKVYAIK